MSWKIAPPPNNIDTTIQGQATSTQQFKKYSHPNAKPTNGLANKKQVKEAEN